MGLFSSFFGKNDSTSSQPISPQQQLASINQQYSSDPIARIQQKLLLAAQVDNEHQEFGSEKHQYRLNPPLSIEKVQALQEQTGCQFPDDYIAFITLIGNGGAGPYYGIEPFDEVIDRFPLSNYALPCNIKPKMNKQEWKTLSAIDEEADDEEFDLKYHTLHQGLLYLGTCGCEYDLFLVINGPYSGHIVYTSDWINSDTPYFFSYESSFIKWYERWLNEIILGYDTSWFGHRMGGNEEALIAYCKNAESIEDMAAAVNSLTKLPELSHEGQLFLEQQLYTDHIELYKAAFNALAKLSPERIIPFIHKELNKKNIDRQHIAVTAIFHYQKENYSLFKDELLPILRETRDIDTVRYIGYIFAQLDVVKVEHFSHLFTHHNPTMVTAAIYAASHDVELKNKVNQFFDLIISENPSVSLHSIQAAVKIKEFNAALVSYLQMAWKLYPTEKDPYIRNNITSYINTYGKDHNINLKQW